MQLLILFDGNRCIFESCRSMGCGFCSHCPSNFFIILWRTNLDAIYGHSLLFYKLCGQSLFLTTCVLRLPKGVMGTERGGVETSVVERLAKGCWIWRKHSLHHMFRKWRRIRRTQKICTGLSPACIDCGDRDPTGLFFAVGMWLGYSFVDKCRFQVYATGNNNYFTR